MANSGKVDCNHESVDRLSGSAAARASPGRPGRNGAVRRGDADQRPPDARLPLARRPHPAAGPGGPHSGGGQAARRAGARHRAVRQPDHRRRRLRGAAGRGLPGIAAWRRKLDRRAGRESAPHPGPGPAAAGERRLDDRPRLCRPHRPRALADPRLPGGAGGTAALRAHPRRLPGRPARPAPGPRRPLHRARHPDHARADHGHHRGHGRRRRHLPAAGRARRAGGRRVTVVRQCPSAHA